MAAILILTIKLPNVISVHDTKLHSVSCAALLYICFVLEEYNFAEMMIFIFTGLSVFLVADHLNIWIGLGCERAVFV